MLNKARDFVEGNILYLQKETLPLHIQEQVSLREYLCSDCLEQARCKICKCPTPKMFYAPNKVDSENKWAEFLSQAQ